jgi:hypothetical protein
MEGSSNTISEESNINGGSCDIQKQIMQMWYEGWG